ncbi:MAG: UDP-N-acetylmuramate dehydrogenase [Ruminococcaceae bacterium]|nr:UDP-N-acetylmuramate dehydrogenase [Oscillospiraceae bacterium]
MKSLKSGAEALGFRCTLDEPMREHTSFLIGGPADLFIEVADVNKMPQLLALLKECDVPFTVVGRGTNLLVSDEGIGGAVVFMADESLNFDGETVTAAAGVKLTKMCVEAKVLSLSGFEFACGIPGTVGGAVYMNAGAYGGEIKDVIVSCTSLTQDGKVVTRTADELALGYRTSIFKTNGEIILSAAFKLIKGNKETIRSTMEDLLQKRKAKQPVEFPSAGSTFKRPEGYFAAALIEQCGLKGYSVGDAEVSVKHSGFVINKGNATAADVLQLIEDIKKTVFEQTGVNLEMEVIFKGR